MATLGTITEPRPQSLQQASVQLSSNQCSQRYSAATEVNKISGWTIIFGAFSEKRQAQNMIKKNKSNMGQYAKYGRSVIIKRMMGGSMLWHALWSGLVKDQAGKTCKLLWSKGKLCTVLHPSVIADKNAQWY